MRYRRGLSTVVGAVFFIIATTTVVTYITYSMNSIDNFSQSVIVSESQNIDRGRESITISQVGIVNNKFNMTVTNTGSLPVKLTRLWVTNQNGITDDQKADLNIQLNPGQQQYNIGQSTVITADSTASYNLKVVTERGNISTFQVSPNTSTRIQLITPGTIAPNTNFKVVSLITNNSTTPNNIANLNATMNYTGTTMTKVDGPTPSIISTLPQGSTASFTWTYTSPATTGVIIFNGSYVGAPSGSFVLANTTNQLSAEAAAATSSQWSQAASRVGILISGIPNPVETSATGGTHRFGIGIINPLDRPVDIYSVSVSTMNIDYLGGSVVGYEPLTGWRLQTSGNNIVIWEGGTTPVVIPPRSVGQFRVTTQGSSIGSAPTELLTVVQALSSEGKLSVMYPMAAKSTYSTINVFYTPTPLTPTVNWGYLIKDIPSGKTTQVFNATLENSSSAALNSKIRLIILVPNDFTEVTDVSAGTGGWDAASIYTNPDGSKVISVQTSSKPFNSGTQVYKFSAKVPTVTETKLYVFQTTSVYVDWVLTDALQTASALSEAGVQVLQP